VWYVPRRYTYFHKVAKRPFDFYRKNAAVLATVQCVCSISLHIMANSGGAVSWQAAACGTSENGLWEHLFATAMNNTYRVCVYIRAAAAAAAGPFTETLRVCALVKIHLQSVAYTYASRSTSMSYNNIKRLGRGDDDRFTTLRRNMISYALHRTRLLCI